MKKYFLVNDKSTQSYLDSIFSHNHYITIQDDIEESILFVHLQSNKNDIATILVKYSHCKIAIISDNPIFNEGYKLIPFNIKAYANTYMANVHYKQLVWMLKSDNNWFYPEFTQELINFTFAKQNHNSIFEKLTSKEIEVAKLVAKSLKNHDIADELNIKERTVKQHLSNIFEKLQIKDRVTLALMLK